MIVDIKPAAHKMKPKSRTLCFTRCCYSSRSTENLSVPFIFFARASNRKTFYHAENAVVVTLHFTGLDVSHLAAPALVKNVTVPQKRKRILSSPYNNNSDDVCILCCTIYYHCSLQYP